VTKQQHPITFLVLLAALALGLGAAARAAKPPKVPAAPADGAAPQFEPGKETRVDDPSLGGQGYYVVYLPKEYTADRTWPAVFCYHGVDQQPKVWPFKDVVGGKGFVVVGMCYAGGPSLDAYKSTHKDIENVRRLAPELAKRLKLDPRQLFIGGFSMGGFIGSSIGEGSSEMWAGMMICGAGRGGGEGGAGAQGFRGKPVYLAAGEKDEYLASARKSADAYRAAGADVTFETYAGIGHGVNTKSKVLADWLWTNGPLKQVKADLAEARALQAAGKLGLAYAKFQQVAAVPGGSEPCVEAGKAAQTIGKEAEGQLAAADAALAAKKYAEAMPVLSRVAAAYAGSQFGERAAKSLAALSADPNVKAALDKTRQEAQARTIEEQAQAAELAKNYAQAIRLWEQLAATCPASDRAEAARKRAEFLKADPATQAAVAGRDAERDGRAWLSMADNFIQAGAPDKAREYLQKVLDKYPGTEWAKQAQERLKKLK
jgi:tetratricopeptide (TPR) repeat protein